MNQLSCFKLQNTEIFLIVSDALLAMSGKSILSTGDFAFRGCLNSVFRKKAVEVADINV